MLMAFACFKFQGGKHSTKPCIYIFPLCAYFAYICCFLCFICYLWRVGCFLCFLCFIWMLGCSGLGVLCCSSALFAFFGSLGARDLGCSATLLLGTRSVGVLGVLGCSHSPLGTWSARLLECRTPGHCSYILGHPKGKSFNPLNSNLCMLQSKCLNLYV